MSMNDVDDFLWNINFLELVKASAKSKTIIITLKDRRTWSSENVSRESKLPDSANFAAIFLGCPPETLKVDSPVDQLKSISYLHH
jgi:hypothetical protein